MMATYNNNNSHPLPAAPMGGAQMQPPPPQAYQQYQRVQQQQPPPPPPPQQQQQPIPLQQRQSVSQNGRPKSRTFSFKSDKSHKSGSTHQKVEPETHAEKEAKRLHTKADPTLAINEAEPSIVAATVKSSLAPLRSITHRDSNGNPIAEPDKSNPTRYRWERPLDTIRSFEAAIDGGYNRKSTFQPTSDSESVANYSRRSSYFNHNNARFPQDSYYGGRPQSHLPTSHSAYDVRQSYYDHGAYNNNNNNGGYGGGYYGGGGGRQRFSRMTSDYGYQNNGYYGGNGRPNMGGEQPNGVYPMPNNHRSYETVASGSGSGTSGEAGGYQTDPTSSDNSSIERMHSPAKPRQQQPSPKPQQQPQQPMNDYGIAFQSPAVVSNLGSPLQQSMSASRPVPVQLSQQPPQMQMQMQQQQQQQRQGPPPPQKNVITRKPSKLTSAPPVSLQATPAADKRKSWFSRRFSRQA